MSAFHSLRTTAEFFLETESTFAVVLDNVRRECNLIMIWLIVSLGTVAASPSATLLQGPIPVNYTGWPITSDMPPDTFEGGGWVRTFLTRLTVRQDGTLQSCEVERGTGRRTLDKAICAMFEQRARFRPAVWADGSPSYGVFRFTFKLFRDHPRPSKSDPVDLDVRVDRKAYAGQVPASVHVVFEVDQDGRPGDCISAAPFDSGIAANPPSLVPLACDAVIHRFVPRAAKDELGKSVRSVQNAVVRIRTN
jgi:hypothetical protein